MRRNNYALLSFFLFILLIKPSFAYLSLDKNVSAGATLGTPKYFTCYNSNTSDKGIFCFVFGGTSHKIYRWDSNIANLKSCTINNTYTDYGGILVNNTTAYIQYISGSILGFDVSNIASGNCPMIDSQSMSGTTAGAYYLGTNYQIGNIYYMGNGVFDSSFTSIEAPFWIESSTSNNSVVLSNISSNSTIWITKVGGLGGSYSTKMYQFTNKAYVSKIDYYLLWNIGSGTKFIIPALVKINSTTIYGYFLDASINYIYRVNFTAGITAGEGTNLPAFFPLNNTIVSSSPQLLKVYLTTSNNGTLTFYLNNTLIGGTSFNITTPFVNQEFSSSTGVLTENQGYSWYANFTDIFGNTWITPVETFSFNLHTISYFVSNPMNYIALTIGGAFSVQDLTTSQLISSILISLGGAVVIVIFIATKSHDKLDGHALTQTMTYSFVILLVLFTLIGWFPAWIWAVLITLAGLYYSGIFSKIGG